MDKKIHCSRCGGEHLQFVNVPVSVKGKCTLIRYFRIFYWFCAIMLSIVTFSEFYTLMQQTIDESTGTLILLAILCVLNCTTIMQAIALTIVEYFIPYQNDNITKYVCETCGNCEDLEIIALKDFECVYSSDGDTADS